MHIVCIICSDFLNACKKTYVTKCGHMFHQNCIILWIQRSHTCPQCRNPVTEGNVFRVFPTAAEAREDATTLQAQLDEALLQLRYNTTRQATKDKQIQELTAQCNKSEETLKACERRLLSKETALASLREQLEYLKVQNKDIVRLKEENETLKKNLQTLTGLQKVLDSTKAEVEHMLAGYTDVRTVALFATALKDALCESENKRKEFRERCTAVLGELRAERILAIERQLAFTQLEQKFSALQRNYEALKNKRKASEVLSAGSGSEVEAASARKQRRQEPRDSLADNPSDKTVDEHNVSTGGLARRVANSQSPYLRLRRAPLALAAGGALRVGDRIKPSELALFNNAQNAKPSGNENAKSHEQNKLSIFRKKESVEVVDLTESQPTSLDVSYDGLGGHARPDSFPRCRCSCLPKLTAKHKLKRPNTRSTNIGKLFKRINDESS